MDRFTTMEHLALETNPTYGAVIKYGDRVFHTDLTWKGGFSARVYEFIDDPEETGLGDIECRLSLIAEATEEFEDSGHAIEWCMRQKQSQKETNDENEQDLRSWRKNHLGAWLPKDP